MVYYALYPSPLGQIVLTSDGVALTGLQLSDALTEGIHNPDLAVFYQSRQWLDDYFAGRNPDPSVLPLAPGGTPFQKEVWRILCRVPYGEVITYGQIARELASPRGGRMSAQAVGQAIGKNPIWIVIPCHRCVGSGGKLTGYTGGLDAKLWLLRHEGHNY